MSTTVDLSCKGAPGTRARVEDAIRELRYRPDVSARQLKHSRAGFLALAVPAMEAPCFGELAALVTAGATRLGYLCCWTPPAPTRSPSAWS